jgi:hypothetical protein
MANSTTPNRVRRLDAPILTASFRYRTGRVSLVLGLVNDKYGEIESAETQVW